MNEDRIMSNENTEALLIRHGALLERVTVLERALEYEYENTLDDATKWRVRAALDG